MEKSKKTTKAAPKETVVPAVEEPTAAVEQQPPKHRRIIYAAAAALIVVILGGWFACSVYATKLTVGDMQLSAHSSNVALTRAFTTQAAAYKLAVNYPGGTTKQFHLSDLGMSLNATASLQATRAQSQQFVHRLRWWKPQPAVLVLNQNESTLNNFIAHNINVTVQPSKDAKLTVVKGVIRLTDATAGKEYGLKQPMTTLLAATRNLQAKAIKLQTLKIDPALTTSILEPYKAELSKTLDQPASFVIGSQTVKPSPAQIASWLDITPNDKTKKVSITVNSGKIVAYINSIADGAIRPPRDQVDVTRSNGSVQVLVAGVDGVDVVNKSGVSTSVAKNLLSGQGFHISLPVSAEPYQVVKTGSYAKWIEVDLTNKVLYAYQYNKLVKSYLVSAGAPATPTVTGQYKIYAKYLQQNMAGENVDGSSYYQPDVQWINYFYSDFAIHGNYWRPLSYFGHVNSSHGCVGLLNDNAEWVYNWAPIGTPVIIHT